MYNICSQLFIQTLALLFYIHSLFFALGLLDRTETWPSSTWGTGYYIDLFMVLTNFNNYGFSFHNLLPPCSFSFSYSPLSTSSNSLPLPHLPPPPLNAILDPWFYIWTCNWSRATLLLELFRVGEGFLIQCIVHWLRENTWFFTSRTRRTEKLIISAQLLIGPTRISSSSWKLSVQPGAWKSQRVN